jgi:hypothetical protein
LRAGLTILLEAYDLARSLHVDLWDFAVEIDSLRSAGLSHNSLRWLLSTGQVLHAIEYTPAEAGKRCFRPVSNLTLTGRTCFILTEGGAAVARQGTLQPPSYRPEADPSLAVERGEFPHWDERRRQLRWRTQVVKQFKGPAPNQELILTVFEEEGWPPCIDDPLPRDLSQDPKERLHDTIKNLNRNQVQPLIFFGGNGRGTGVRWDWRE